MNRWFSLGLGALLTAALVLIPALAPTAEAADCRRVSISRTPITELGTERYQGYPGGLYVEGMNTPPAGHLALALGGTAAVQPLRADGSADSGGRIVLLSVGTSITTLEYQAFMTLARGDPQINPAVLLVDGAQGGHDARSSRDPASPYWTTIDERLRAAGATRQQVQVVWLEMSHTRPTGPFPESAEGLRDDLIAIVGVLHERLPNLKLLYFSSRAYAGYASTNQSPEPYAYESAYAARWVIEQQIIGQAALNADPKKGDVKAPVVLWGPYTWADGTTGRSDGLVWQCEDFLADGTHPSISGRQKVANMLMAFFKTDDTARPWFMLDAQATPLPTATVPPAPTQPIQPTMGPRPTRGPMPTLGPTITPGGPTLTPWPTLSFPTRVPTITPGGPTITPNPTQEAMMQSYRVTEVPSGDQMWVTIIDRFLQRAIERLSPERNAWLCGSVMPDAGAEWRFTFASQGLSIAADAPGRQRSTIRAIAADPAAVAGQTRCIRIGGATEYVEGTPPPPGTPGTPVPTWEPGPGPGPTRGPTRTPRASATPTDRPVPTPETRIVYLPVLAKNH